MGGGVGGLAVGAALATNGWQVAIFERDAGPAVTGTALGMWPSALAALDHLGVGARVRALGTPQAAAVFSRPDGTRIGSLDVKGLRRRTGESVHLLSRPALLGLLRAGVPESALRFGSAIADASALQKDYDVVVAADGIFSGTREALFGARFGARYTGITAWRGQIDTMPTESLIETWGRGGKFGVTPQEDGRTNWYATTVAPERAFTPGRERAALRELFGSWHGGVRGVLDAIVEEGIFRHDLYVVPPLPTYVRDTVALIGDAAHAMTPDLGRGACEALIDAVTLAQCLDAHSSVVGGLRAYDQRRRRPTQRLAVVASTASRLTRWTRALWLRNALLRLSLLAPTPA